MGNRSLLLLSLFLLLFRVGGGEMWAATVVPPDGILDMAQSSDAVVLARAGASACTRHGPLPFTVTQFTVLRSLRGPFTPGASLEVEVPGGTLDGAVWLVPGAPRFPGGERFLLFLMEGGGVWRPSALSLGLLRGMEGGGIPWLEPLGEAAELSLLLPPAGASQFALAFREEDLLGHLSASLAGLERWDPSAAGAEAPSWVPMAPPTSCVFMNSGGTSFRFNRFDSGGSLSMFAQSPGDTSLSGGGFAEVSGAVDSWDAISGTTMDLRYGGPTTYTLNCTSGQDTPPSGTNIVIFNDPCSDIPNLSGCSGTLAFGGPWAQGTHIFDGVPWYTNQSCFVVVNNGSGCIGSTNYALMMAHELGHGLGFGHVSDPDALMYYMCCHPINATDETCARYLYPGTAVCEVSCTATVPASSTSGTPVPFQSTATPANCAGTPTFAWTFGDGSSSSLQNPSHTYGASGSFAWTLTATVDSVPCTRGGSISITSSCSISCTATVPATGATGLPVPFGATASPKSCTGIPTYAWSFGDGGTSSQQNPTHTYGSSGTFSWSMTTSVDGKSCSRAGNVLIAPAGSWPGDCDGDGSVSIGEVQKVINAFLGIALPACGADCNGDGTVSIGEVQKVINAFLGIPVPC